MSDNIVYALFEPTEPKLLSTLTQAQLLVDNPLLASALSNIFPYLLVIDNALKIVTWTNDDPFLNILFVALYSVIVLYWKYLKYWFIPSLAALVFSSVVWNTSSIMHDAKFDEKPTIDEVLLTLHNITVRFELLLRPAKHLDMSMRNYIKMVLGAVILSPIHLVIVKFLFLPQTCLWFVGVLALTYHSPFSFAVRRLLWRSAYLRKVIYHLTGLNIRLMRSNYSSPTSRAHETISRTHSPSGTDVEVQASSNPIADTVQAAINFVILKKVVVSLTQLKHVVRYDVLENERRWLGLGWSKYLLPNERASFCYEKLMLSAPDPHTDAEFVFPVYENDLFTYQWQWVDDKWSIDLEYNRSRFPTGWVYYDKNWGDQKYEDGFSRYTRTRKWTRRAILLIDKRAEVYDEQSSS
ncbi:Pex24p integral peroxisomal membrane peroxin [Metschnikowia bicuspidata var. bicuspidata NRRL YB-4993]|uniref:Pex24p integral peroxisomal membrane peroxin n=1 Tax=Metschnikowia bicuspidata var. bicuspidata NRRL YB-4993 TaxID=869754 RepID=A0A1A0HKM3_9ASCO|nr:Pex24p integral peroxisomal membrane peroxin [Metschnikowia bicuspidata var. bicuspidata NRRL YB-4993]OBA24541.1 Pex24p integral peroxisomal membrane peroxin [Metschnikowia bicuspidata var. bicuspidata NRRL YB-4993]